MSWRKGSNASVETSGGSNGSRGGGASSKGAYPFALTLRIRVVQIVCGIAAVVMGSVAAIEERQNFNLSLGVPAGAITVLAAAWSVHRSVHRNAGGRRGGEWADRILWASACILHVGLLALSARTAFRRHRHGHSHASNTSLALAIIQGLLAAATLAAAILVARLRWIHGPTPAGPPPRSDRCPRSTSHTAVSMVPLASTYGGHSINNDSVSKNADNLSSDNEMMEINIADNKATFTDVKSSPKIKNVNIETPKFDLQPLHILNTSPLKLLENDFTQHKNNERQPHQNEVSLKGEQINISEKISNCNNTDNSNSDSGNCHQMKKCII